MSHRYSRTFAHVLALWFGCGRAPFAPGTAGTLGALPLFLLVRPYGVYALGLVAALITLIGIWSASIVAEDLGTEDPQVVVIDEVAGVLITWMAAPQGWKGVLVGFVLFRFFDMVKPWPARSAEELPKGWGIVLDDVAAGIWGALVLLALRWAAVV